MEGVIRLMMLWCSAAFFTTVTPSGAGGMAIRRRRTETRFVRRLRRSLGHVHTFTFRHRAVVGVA
jgi:hypothetical protein